MSHEATDSAVYPATVTVPDDGDVDNMTTWMAPLQDLINRTAYLKTIPSGGFVTVASGGEIRLSGGSTIQVQSGAETQYILGGASRWYNGSAASWESGALLNINLGGVLSIDGTANVEATGALDVKDGGTETVEDGGTLSLESGSLLTAAAGSTVVLSGSNTVAGGTVTAPLVCTTDGEFRQRSLSVAANADAVYGVADATVITMTHGVLSAGRTWTITTTGAGNGASMTLITLEDTHTLYIVANSITYPLLKSTGYMQSITLTMTNGAWQPSGCFMVQ